MTQFFSESNFADIMGVSRATMQKWIANGTFVPEPGDSVEKVFDVNKLLHIEEIRLMVESKWDEEMKVVPSRRFTSIELFAGAGGLALGMEKAGFEHILLNEFDSSACKTLRQNRKHWAVVEGDVRNVDFTPLKGKVDFLSGGFPCQAFSYAGKQGGFSDTRGTLFFELARAVKEIQPKVFMGENVKGLTSHDDGRTFETIKNAISELGYTLVEPRVLKAIVYQVPQKRERLILIAIRNDIAPKVQFKWPSPYTRVMNLRDALYKGVIFDTDVPVSNGAKYPPKKEAVLKLVPQGGDWRNLPEEVAKEYMGGSWFLGGGKTGMARRLSLDEPSLTLTCSPCQKQTERCHPIETRPLTVREYARIQTFPDDWDFAGSMNDQYKQIGNAVPVNLAWAVGRSLIRLFNDIQAVLPEDTSDFEDSVKMVCDNFNSQKLVEKAPIKSVACKVHQLNFAEVLQVYPSSVVIENTKTPQLDVDFSKNVLISLVKSDNMEQYLDRSAKVYYTGKKFPSTVALNKLYYFMPYFKQKGVRDLYFIKIARVGSRKEGQPDNDPNDFRLVFEIEFVGELFKDFKNVDLNIWHTFRDSTIEELVNA